jgi:hypothetical protein
MFTGGTVQAEMFTGGTVQAEMFTGGTVQAEMFTGGTVQAEMFKHVAGGTLIVLRCLLLPQNTENEVKVQV